MRALGALTVCVCARVCVSIPGLCGSANSLVSVARVCVCVCLFISVSVVIAANSFRQMPQWGE